MIEYISYSEALKDGNIKIQLSETYGYIGLVKLCIPPLVSSDQHIVVEIRVQEIDKTYNNPHRVLNRFNFNLYQKIYFNKVSEHTILWQKLDSSTNEINMTFVDEYGSPIIVSDGKYSNVDFTLALMPRNSEWINKI